MISVVESGRNDLDTVRCNLLLAIRAGYKPVWGPDDVPALPMPKPQPAPSPDRRKHRPVTLDVNNLPRRVISILGDAAKVGYVRLGTEELWRQMERVGLIAWGGGSDPQRRITEGGMKIIQAFEAAGIKTAPTQRLWKESKRTTGALTTKN